MLPSLAGKMVSISEAPENMAATYREEMMVETKLTLLKPYKKMCERKKVVYFVFIGFLLSNIVQLKDFIFESCSHRLL